MARLGPGAALLLLALCVLSGPAVGRDRTPAPEGQEWDTLLKATLKAPGSLQSRIWFEHLTSADGLSQDSVFAILQDRHGFMWFGTQGGLNRYDGYRVTQYRHDPNNPSSLGSDFVQTLFEDSKGTIWVARNLLSGLNPETETFTHYAVPSASSEDPTRAIRVIYEDQRGFLWLGMTAGRILYRFDPRTASFTGYDIGGDFPEGLSCCGVQAIHSDGAGVLWLGTSRGLVRFDLASGTSIRYRHDRADLKNVTADGIIGIAADAAGKLWVADTGGLSRFDPETRTFSGYRNWPSGRLQASFEQATYQPTAYIGPSGMVLLGTQQGLKFFEPGSGTLRVLRHDPADPHSLSGNEVWSIRSDRDGNLWVGVKGGGVNRFSLHALRFGAWRSDSGDRNTLSENNVRSIYEDRDGIVWIGTYEGGLNRFEPGSGKFSHYRHNSADPRSLADDHAFPIYEDRSGTLWIGTFAGLNRLDRKTGTFARFKGSGLNKRIYSLLEDRQGRFWLAGGSISRAVYDRQTGTVTRMDATGGQFPPWDEIDGLSMHEDRNGDLWFASPLGLNKLDPKGNTRQIPLSHSVGPGGPPRIQVNFFHEDAEGMLWLATETGLVQFDPKTEKYTSYTTRDGLPDNIVQCILPDEAGNLWISTAKGISRFNPRDNSFFNYSESDGLQGTVLQPEGMLPRHSQAGCISAA